MAYRRVPSSRGLTFDYEQYIPEQFQPAAEGLLQMLALDFGDFSSRQMRLFETARPV
jgi:hypothetical protein